MLLLASVGQTPAGDASAAPVASERAAYKITLNTGREIFGFWEEREDRGNTWRVEVDAPWKREKDYQFINKNSVTSTEAEWRGAREARIAKGWKDAGFSEIGVGRHYATQEVALAARAKEMAANLDKQAGEEGDPPAGLAGGVAISEDGAAPATQISSNASPEKALGDNKSPGRKSQLMRWSRHLALLLIGCGCIYLVARKCFPSGLS